ncbi:MAG: DUF1566 domain-containing protein [Rhodospirillales bacterium]|nr:DUF1566 domain-containing protein [Rhodospirillales bacterium]MCB9996265.1 DUF1566 domain-containing protein [Rhodospirillales bacterium]
MKQSRLYTRHFLDCVVALLLAMTMLAPSATHAACSNPAGVAGEITYLTDRSMMVYCDGTNWTAMGREIASCPNIGDVCGDGTVYAGQLSTKKLYAPPVDQSAAITWNNGTTNRPATGATSDTDGAANTLILDGSGDAGAPYQAAQLCANLDAYGHTDWYLPAKDELNVMYSNKAALGISLGIYQTSTEYTVNNVKMWTQNFGGGGQTPYDKDIVFSVRCVRSVDDGLVGHWTLDETSGTTAADVSGNGNNGTMQGGLNAGNDSVTGPGGAGTALKFDGTDDVIEVADDDLFSFTDGAGNDEPFSIGLWVNADNTSNKSLLYKWSAGVEWRMTFDAIGNSINMQLYDGGIADSLTISKLSNYKERQGEWIHFMVTYDGSELASGLNLYVDGKSVSATKYLSGAYAGMNNTASLVQIGAGGGGSTFMDGSIDDVRIYNRALSASEIAQLFCQGIPGKLSYNSTDHVMQFCSNQGLHWMGKTSPDPAASCSTIGDTCPDGSYYAGLSPDGNVPMYMADVASETTDSWNNGTTNWTVTGFTNATDGDGHTAGLVSLADAGAPYDAAGYCDSLSAHGHSDWYLPAISELSLLWNGGTPVGDIKTDGTSYWTSSELSSSNGYFIRFNDFNQGPFSKNTAVAVRCVRKGSPGACSNPTGAEGSLTFNTTFGVMQYCNGTAWVSVGKAGVDPCAGSPVPGTACADGTVYAGNLSGTDLFVPPADQSAGTTWNNGTFNWTVTGATSNTDGAANTTTLDGLADAGSPHQAAKLCAGLSAHGHTDWYLPAKDELNVLYINRAAIGGFETSGSYYWSSTEYDNFYAWRQRFSDGIQDSNTKNGTFAVRCARR